MGTTGTQLHLSEYGIQVSRTAMRGGTSFRATIRMAIFSGVTAQVRQQLR